MSRFDWLDPFAETLARRPARVEVVLLDAGNTLAHVDHARIAELAAQVPSAPPTDTAEVREAEIHARVELSARLGPRIVAGDLEALETPEVVTVYLSAMLDHLGWAQNIQKRASLVGRFVVANREKPLWRVRAPGDEAALAALKERGCRLAVVSNSDGRVEGKLREIGLADWFEVIVDSKVVGVEKPDPRIFDIALDRLGHADRETVVHVGDLVMADVLGAARAGIVPVLLDPLGAHREAGFAGHCAADLGELVQVLFPGQ